MITSPPLEKKDCYLGNVLLKRSGVKTKFTAAQLKELAKCGHDIDYFVTTYCKIISLDHGEVIFKLYGYQKKVLKSMQLSRFSMYMLPRQMGKTQITAAFMLHQVLFNSHYTIAILANKSDASREILSRIQFMYELLPSWMQLGVVTWNKGDIELDNHSKIFTAATSPSSIRGRAVNLLYLDEFAHVDRDVEFWTSTFPVISSGQTTKVIITSTPNGLNLFYKLWQEGLQGKNPFKVLYIPWTEHPQRDKKWEAEQLQSLGPLKFRQECLCEFQGSSGTLISGTKLQQLAFGEPVHQDEWLTVYAKPDSERRYVATADISEGVERDFSVCTIFDVTEKPFRIAAVYRSNIVPPSVFTEVLYRLGTQYNKALMIPETNSMGKQVAHDLWYEYDYDAVLRTVNKETGHVINYGHGSELGIRTTKPTKRLGCSSLKSLIETDLLIVQDYQAITELGTFISNGSSWSAANDKCDDVVMTLVIFAWFTQQRYFEEYMSDSINSVFRKAYQDEQYGLCSVFLSDGIATTEEDPSIDYSLINRSSTPLL